MFERRTKIYFDHILYKQPIITKNQYSTNFLTRLVKEFILSSEFKLRRSNFQVYIPIRKGVWPHG